MKARFEMSGSSFDLTLEIEALVRLTSLSTYLACNAVEREEHLTHLFLKAISSEILVIALRNIITLHDAITVSIERQNKKDEKILIKLVDFN